MNFNENYEKIFFNFSLSEPKYLLVTRENFYANKDINILAFLAKKFYEKFKETPSKEQMKLLVANSSRAKGIISDSIIDLVYDINLSDYDAKWLIDTAEPWIKWRNFDISLIDGIEYIKTAKVEPENAELIINKFRDIINNRNKLNFDKDLGLNFFDAKDHYQQLADKIQSGKRFVDQITNGGYDKCSLVVYAGEQNIGKCLVGSQFITIKNKITDKMSKIKIGDFFKLIKDETI